MGAQVTSAIDATFGAGGPVDEVYEAIADASPDATVVTTQYMPLVPASDEDGCPITDGIGPDNVEWARAVTGQINDAVAAAAERNGHVAVMPTDVVDRSACAPADQRWTSFLGDPNTAQMHPTALGQEAMAAAIADAI